MYIVNRFHCLCTIRLTQQTGVGLEKQPTLGVKSNLFFINRGIR